MKNQGPTGMKCENSENTLLKICLLSLVLFMTMVLSASWAAEFHKPSKVLGNDDTEFTFMGKCDNGENYRLFSYSKIVNGNSYSFYDYEGPVGKGTVKSNATPRTLSVRICRKFAEIIDEN